MYISGFFSLSFKNLFTIYYKSLLHLLLNFSDHTQQLDILALFLCSFFPWNLINFVFLLFESNSTMNCVYTWIREYAYMCTCLHVHVRIHISVHVYTYKEEMEKHLRWPLQTLLIKSSLFRFISSIIKSGCSLDLAVSRKLGFVILIIHPAMST